MPPRYVLFRITDGRTIILRRAEDAKRVADKAVRKDIGTIFPPSAILTVLSYLDLEDKARYDSNHKWDWMNT